MIRKASTRRTTAANGSPVPGELVSATRAADVVAVPKRQCLAINGKGSPQAPAFAEAIGALYGTAYTLKFGRKKATKARQDFKVGPLEGRWSADAPPGTKGVPSPDRWRWRLRIGVPADVTLAEVEGIKRDVVAKKGGKLQGSALVAQVFLESIPAQRAGRILHVGPYGKEPASFDLIAQVLEKAGLPAAPTHIEVYLNDPSRTNPDKLKTVLLRDLASSARRNAAADGLP